MIGNDHSALPPDGDQSNVGSSEHLEPVAAAGAPAPRQRPPSNDMALGLVLWILSFTMCLVIPHHPLLHWLIRLLGSAAMAALLGAVPGSLDVSARRDNIWIRGTGRLTLFLLIYYTSPPLPA